MILIDTNILLRIEQLNHPDRELASQAIETLMLNNYELFIVPQVISEFWSVATRPINNNGLGMSCPWTSSKVENLKSTFTLRRNEPGIFDQWLSLVSQYDVKGKNVHDAMLVAAMLVHGLTYILTFNVGDFKRFQEITVIHPQQIHQGFALP